MQDNYNKDLENKGWAQMSALLDKERPVAIPFWKRAWRKLALGLILFLASFSLGVYLYNTTTNFTNKTAIIQTVENSVNQQVTSVNSTNAPSIAEATLPSNTTIQNSSQLVNSKANTLSTNRATNVTSNNNQVANLPLKSSVTARESGGKATQEAIFLVEKGNEEDFGGIDPLWLLIEHREDSLEALQIEEAYEEKMMAKEPIAQLEQLPLGDFALTASFANIDTDINTPKAKVIENFMLSYDNGYDFGLKNYSSGIFAGLDIPLKNKKWSFRPSLGYNSTRSIIIASQNTQPEGSAVSVNSPIVDTDSEITVYVTNVEEEVLNSENKGAPFFTDYRINELHLQLKAAYRLNDKWSVFGGMTPTYLLNNTQGILPTLTWGAQRMQANFDANQSAVLGVANRINLNGMMGIDYQVVPRFSVSAAYNHGWVKKARTDLIDTKLKSINLSLNYHF